MQKQPWRERLRPFSLPTSALVSVLVLGCADGVASPSPLAVSEADGGGAGAAVVAERIAFTLGPWGVASDIGTINPDGSDLINLTMSPEPEMMGGWSPGGSSILFVRGVSPEEFHVWRMNPDGGGQEQLTAGPGVRLAPTSSPDGNHILYMQSSDLSAADADIYMADSDGSNPVQLTSEPGPDGCPRMSPDGTRIVFSSARSGGTALDLFTMAPDGSDVVQLTQVKGTELCASWSPDGAKIAYGHVGNRRPGIYVVNADGSSETRIHAHGFAAQPSWSPGGDRLVFHRYHGGALDLYSTYADGSGLMQLTDLKEAALNPIWSP